MDYYFMGSSGDNTNQPKTSSSFENDSVLTGMEAGEISNGHQTHVVNEPMDQVLREQYTEELKQVDEEIQTLKQVLSAKYVRQNFLRRQLGLTVINELRNEVKHGIDNLRTSEAYQRTSAAVKTAKDKTSAVIQEKWSIFKLSNTYKTLEDKVGSAYSSVRGKMGQQTQSVGEQPSDVFKTDESDVVEHLIQETEHDGGINVSTTSSPGTLQMDSLTLDEADAAELSLESAQSAPAASGQSQRKGKHRGGQRSVANAS